tara:strand:- start:80 stop:223 length:144 start_codon:yes stop_codon:yes gene_type:complete
MVKAIGNVFWFVVVFFCSFNLLIIAPKETALTLFLWYVMLLAARNVK